MRLNLSRFSQDPRSMSWRCMISWQRTTSQEISNAERTRRKKGASNGCVCQLSIQLFRSVYFLSCFLPTSFPLGSSLDNYGVSSLSSILTKCGIKLDRTLCDSRLSSSTTSVWPLSLAICNAVRPSLFLL